MMRSIACILGRIVIRAHSASFLDALQDHPPHQDVTLTEAERWLEVCRERLPAGVLVQDQASRRMLEDAAVWAERAGRVGQVYGFGDGSRLALTDTAERVLPGVVVS